jgi:hypothetical protein
MDELEAAIDTWLQERLSMIPLEREAVALTNLAAECGDSIPPEQIAARYSALRSYSKAEADLKEALEVVSSVITAGLCGEGMSPETLEALPDTLQAALDDLWEAIEEATKVADA